jgi:hypothetical protein
MSTFVKLNEGFRWVAGIFMVESSAVAKSGVVSVTGPILGLLDVLLRLVELVAPPEEVDQLGQHPILIRLLLQHLLELLDGLVVLVTLQQNLSQNGTSHIVFGVHLQQNSAELLAPLKVPLSQLKSSQ